MLPQHEVPMLLVPGEQEHIWSIYNVLENKFLELKLSLLNDKRFSGSSQGWLVVVNEDYTITLHKSHFICEEDISNVNTSIHLPRLFPPQVFINPEDVINPEEDPLHPEEDPLEDDYPLEEGYDYHVLKALITGGPLRNPTDCTIIVTYGEYSELACMRYGKDTTWTKIADGVRGFHDMVHYKNQFYAIDFSSRLGSFDTCSGTIKWVAPVIEMAYNALVKRYLLESCGELLLIERYIDLSPDARERETRMFRVLKLDVGRAKWIEVKSLGDVAFFVGDNSTISVVASNFNGCQANCVYFTHDDVAVGTQTNRSCDLGLYNLESKRCELYYNLDPTIFPRIFQWPPIWILPPNGH